MKSIGEIKYIINDRYFLAEVAEEYIDNIKNDDEVEVRGKVEIPELDDDVVYPKGKLIVSSQQSDKSMFLLKSKVKMTKTALIPSFDFYSDSEIIDTESPKADLKESAGIIMDMKVRVGDNIYKV